MAEEKREKVKSVKSLQEQTRDAYIELLINVAIDVLIVAAIYFVLIGEKFNHHALTIQGFILLFIPLATATLPISVIWSSRNAYIHGKWVVKEGDDVDQAGPLKNPWLRLVPLGFVLGITTAGIISLILWASGSDDLSPIWVSLIAFVAILLTSAIMLRLNLSRDLAAFAAALSGPRPEGSPSLIHYFLTRHAVPWSVIIGLFILMIGYKGFKEEALKSGGGIDIVVLMIDIALTFTIVCAWMFYESQYQVRPDVHLGLAGPLWEKPLAIIKVLIVIVLIAAGAGAIVGLPMGIAGISKITVFQATLIDVLMAVAAAVTGCALGMQWGRSKEAAALEKEVNP